jgi:hypothetical protein
MSPDDAAGSAAAAFGLFGSFLDSGAGTCIAAADANKTNPVTKSCGGRTDPDWADEGGTMAPGKQIVIGRLRYDPSGNQTAPGSEAGRGGDTADTALIDTETNKAYVKQWTGRQDIIGEDVKNYAYFCNNGFKLESCDLGQSQCLTCKE